MASSKRSRVPDLGRPDITELEFGKTTHRVAVVEPLDVDGVRTMTVGTVIWGVIAIALLPFWGTLQDQGRTWWLWTAIAGLGLGLMGIEYCKRRRDALERAAEPEPAKAPVAAKPATPEKKPAVAKAEPVVNDAKSAEPKPDAVVEPPATPERPVGRRRKN